MRNSSRWVPAYLVLALTCAAALLAPVSSAADVPNCNWTGCMWLGAYGHCQATGVGEPPTYFTCECYDSRWPWILQGYCYN